MVTFSIVIPTHKREKLLNRLLSSINNAFRPASLIEICVVENGDSFCAEKVCQFWAAKLPVTYLYEKEASLSNARNAGTKKTSGDIVLFFDDDVFCDKNTLIAYDKAIQKHGTNNYYGGPLSIEYEEPPPSWLIDFLPDSASGFTLGNAEKVISTPSFLGGNHAIPRKWLNCLGGYDKLCASGENADGGAGGEEKRLQERLIGKAIMGIYSPNAKVSHYVPKERCSKSWALHRQYRYGLTQGLLQAPKEQQTNRRTLSNVPLWLWRAYLRQKFITTFRLPTNNSKRTKLFNEKMKLYEISGYINAYRQTIKLNKKNHR